MTRRQIRLATLTLVMSGIVIAVTLSLYGLRETITFFYSPADLIGPEAQYDIPDHSFRLGGLVADGSVSRENGKLFFTVTDRRQEIRVVYDRLPPDLFREGQGVVATGTLTKTGTNHLFVARDLLAKHDENYMPPEVSRALEKADQ